MKFEQILHWQEAFLTPVLAIGGVTIAFITYYFVIVSKKMEERLRAGKSEEEGQIRWVVFQRVWGGLVLGITALLLPLIGLGESPFKYGMSFDIGGETALIILGMGTLIIIINLLRAGKPANLVTYPQIRARKWDLKLLLMSSMGWVIYLLGYELMFRGFLLYGCIETMGIWPAIAINASIYSFAHFFKGMGETIGAIPFGIIICVLTLYTGNFMLAFIVHCFLALSNQTIAMFAHPEIKYVKQR